MLRRINEETASTARIRDAYFKTRHMSGKKTSESFDMYKETWSTVNAYLNTQVLMLLANCNFIAF